MVNRIKETKVHLFADPVSCRTMRANQVRLMRSMVAYVALRQQGLRGIALAEALCETIRRRLLMIGARVLVSVWRVVLKLPESFPLRGLLGRALAKLRASVPAATAKPPPSTT